jgi:hypothetical protein
MREFDIEDDEAYDDIENEAWDEFKANGGFDLVDSSSGYRYRVRSAVVLIDVGDGNNGFYFGAGYKNYQKNIVDCFNIPANVFEDLFPNDKAEWNCSEATHFFECAANESLEDAKERVCQTLFKAGFVPFLS